MSGDAAPGAVSSSTTPSSSSSDAVSSMAPAPVKAAPAPVVEEVPPSAEAEAEQPDDSTPDGIPETTVNNAPEPELKEATATAEALEPSTTAAAPVEYEALPQPQAPPVAPPTYVSEEIIISAFDAPAVITTTSSSPPTMTSALASTLSSTQASATPAAPTAPVTQAAVPALATAPIIAPPTTPLALHPIRSSGPGGPPVGSNPKHTKQPAKAVPSEKPAEVAVFSDGASAKKPLTLLELPVDILRLIVKEITHTNDLTSLALANSTLYNLAVPHIYSRFDIVWPDPTAPPSEGKSVDALTYGLSTLCLGSAFARTAHRLRKDLRRRGLSSASARKNGGPASAAAAAATANSNDHTRFGSPNYAQYTRKFSLGNGPSDWVAEYMINKEAGKMLGTLVALCVAKMQNLENFVWDMPTGVVSDVFMALASLPDFDPEHDECKLDRLWIRWHNNSQSQSPPASPSSSPGLPPAPSQLFVPQGSNLTPIGIMLPPHSGHPQPRPTIPYASSQVEFPTFSVVPPLRSLTVLDIDEVAYLDELAVLIERSAGRLNELRIGIASHATSKEFVQTWDGANLQQVDLEATWPGESTIGDRRLGGILGILVGRTYDIRKKPPKTSPGAEAAAATQPSSATQSENQANGTAAHDDDGETTPVAPTSSNNALSGRSPQQSQSATADDSEPLYDITNGGPAKADTKTVSENEDEDEPESRLDKKLKLTTLELERVPLSMQVLVRAIDWSSVTTLTILSCPQHESLWRQLKKHFKPTPVSSHGYSISPVATTSTTAGTATSPALNYHMALKSIHTDIVSKALLSFIRETLAPNTLEVLFLQNRRQTDASPQVSIQDIFKSAIKPHRASLTKLLIAGSLHHETNPSNLQQYDSSSRRRRIWTLTTEILNYLTSGRMTSLREMAFSLHYRDWHTFLQRLPNLPQLRSLHIQNIADHVVENLSMYDLAMQVADIVTLRPEVQLCFVGICDKCYEVVESRGSDTASGDMDGLGDGVVVQGVDDASVDGGSDTTSSTSDDDDDGDDDDDEEDVDSDDEIAGVVAGDAGANGSNGAANNAAGHDSDADDSDSGDSDDDSLLLDGEPSVPRPPRLRMREIFFYDDKVAIFKARHGRL
ncbi:hypothetical protein SBRCBS47491_005962 [Sporothrix bragantina]|uniref:F-box domain-containing protein n=1 Tax=Sporothrix bragantina TaxID=671064 RepID=A0ABP0C212_9PEZI